MKYENNRTRLLTLIRIFIFIIKRGILNINIVLQKTRLLYNTKNRKEIKYYKISMAKRYKRLT